MGNLLFSEMKGKKFDLAAMTVAANCIRLQGFAELHGDIIQELRSAGYPIFEVKDRVALSSNAFLSDGPLKEGLPITGAPVEQGQVGRILSIQLGWQPG